MDHIENRWKLCIILFKLERCGLKWQFGQTSKDKKVSNSSMTQDSDLKMRFKWSSTNVLVNEWSEKNVSLTHQQMNFSHC